MIERTFTAEDSSLADAIGLVEETLEIWEVPIKHMMKISVCVEEMFVNVSHYAYPKENGDVKIVLDKQDDTIIITLIDSGIPFNPLEKKDPDITLGIEEREIGGLGIFMVKKNMNETIYERKDGKNIFIMKKKL